MEKRLGIIFTGGEGPPPGAFRRLLDAEAAGAQVIAADSGLALAEAAGLRPDWIIGDMDSLDDENRLRSYSTENIIRHPAAKDYTDTELALALARDLGCNEAWIAGGGGGRLDHLFGIRDLFERERFPRRWITAREDIYCIDGTADGGLSRLELNLEPDAVVSVFPLGGGPWQAESTGLKWPLSPVHWERGLYGLSNTAIAREVMIRAEQGRFMIIYEGGFATQ